MTDIVDEHPIVVGFAGGYCTGKTETAHNIIPPAVINKQGPVVWEHLSFALPLHKLVSIRQGIEGTQRRDRMHYEIHATLLDVLGHSPLYGAPSYDELVQLVYRIAEYPCPRDGKARDFMQQVGTDMVRKYDENAWVKWVDRKVKEKFLGFQREAEQAYGKYELLHTAPKGYKLVETDEEADPEPFETFFGVVVSDCRFINEMEWVKSQPNGILVKFTARPEVIAERQEKRDGRAMTEEEKNHDSEKDFNSLPDEYFDIIIDTSDITVQEQADKVRDLVNQYTGVLVDA